MATHSDIASDCSHSVNVQEKWISYLVEILPIALFLVVLFPLIYLPLCAVNVSLVKAMISNSLSSIGITRFHRYYAVIRLPARHLVSSLCIACTPYSSLQWKDLQDLPSCRNISMRNVPRSTTPRRPLSSCHFTKIEILLSAQVNASALLMGFSELCPFNLLVFGPLPNCLRLKITVTCYPPRLATSEWLVLSRRESHPLYVTTYARPHDLSPCTSPCTSFFTSLF